MSFFSKKKTRPASRLPSLYAEVLIESEYEYRREIRRKLDQLQHDNRDTVRRRVADDHIFAYGHLTKRHRWFSVDKSYRDACRITWNRQYAKSGRTSHIFLPSVYPSPDSSPLTMASFDTLGSHEDENPAVIDERIKQDFLRIHPVMLEVLRAPHSGKLLKHRQEVQTRKKSAQKRQVHIQTTATNDDRYLKLVGSLQQV